MNNDTLVVLVHGFTKSAVDMQYWKKHLSGDFANIITPDLPTTYSSFEDCLDKLSQDVALARPEKFAKLHFAGHSMGGLLSREYLAKTRPDNAGRLLCVGTPHYGSKLADIALLLPGAGMIWKPLHALKTSARKTITSPDIAGLETGVIVSTNNGHWPGKLFLSKNSDGLVESFSALAPDAGCVSYTNAAHVDMQYSYETAEQIRQFLLHGRFPENAAQPSGR